MTWLHNFFWGGDDDRWPPDESFFRLDKRNHLSRRQAYQSVLVLGQTGAGKSTCMQHLIRQAIDDGWGGCFFTVKVDEPRAYSKLYRSTIGWNSREPPPKLRIIGPGHAETFNFIAMLFAASGFDPAAVADALMEMIELMDRRSGRSDKGNAFFTRASRQALIHAATVLHAAGHPVSIKSIADIIVGSPQTPEQAADPTWLTGTKAGYYFQAADARKEELPEAARMDYQQSRTYFFHELAALAPETSSSIRATITGVLTQFIRSPLREICCGESTFNPSDMWDRGHWLLIDMPIHAYGPSALLLQIALKYAIQKEIMRRRDPKRPCLLVMDEAQELISGNDQVFACVSRSSKCATLAMTQNVSNLRRVFGDASEASSWIGNHGNKFFFKVDDQDTIELVQSMAGEHIRISQGGGVDWHDDPLALIFREKDRRDSLNWSEEWRPAIQAADMVRLRPGGSHGYAECIAFRGGELFSNGEHWLRVRMPQLFI